MIKYNGPLICFFYALIVFGACKSDKKDPSASEDLESIETLEKEYAVSPMGKSTQYPDASISNMKFENGRFSFDVAGEKYKLGEQTPDAGKKMCANSGKGQHIHLIVGDRPYSAQYVSNFDHEIPDGEHNILAFLSRSYHESIKTDKAYVAKRVTVQDNSIVNEEDITTPALFYSRPKGTYVGDDTKKIMVDFYVLNAELGKDYKVKLQVNGEVTLIDDWEPYFIEGLPMGQNSIGVALVYPDGSPVPGTQTSTLRQITLARDPVPTEN